MRATNVRRTQAVALIGFMAAGKSTVGRKLAAELGYQFVDTDDLTAEVAGASIAEIFARHGEAGFRRFETEALARAVALPEVVIACGGGVVRADFNVRLLRSRCMVVWLKIGVQAATHRLLHDGPGRPLIDDHVEEFTERHVRRRVRELLAERDPLYEAAAHITQPSGQASPEFLAKMVGLRVIGERYRRYLGLLDERP
ncbi:MAG: shikimate kinase [Fimbriimonadaceae bacterium]|nr:shikimate kinase [Fimbriimonadaceae bacterium]